MAKLNCSFKMKLVKHGKIIAFRTDEYLTPEEFKSLPQKLKRKFKPIHESYSVEHVKE